MDRKLRKLILLTPIICLYSLLIGGGFYVIMKESVGIIPAFGFTEFTFDYYLKAIRMHGFFNSVLFAVIVAGISALLSMVFGTLLAYKLAHSKNKIAKQAVETLIGLGIVLPYLYMVFLVMLFFSQSGIVSRVLYAMNIIKAPSEFPNLLYTKNGLGIIIVYVLKGIPFVTLLVLNIMSKISSRYKDVAMTLGSNKMQTFRKIYMPLSRDTIIWSGMVLMAYDLGSFEVPYIFAGLNNKSFSVMLYSEYLKPSIDSIPVTMAMTVILFGISLCAVIGFAIVVRSLIRRIC